jgi:hypothetical protein
MHIQRGYFDARASRSNVSESNVGSLLLTHINSNGYHQAFTLFDFDSNTGTAAAPVFKCPFHN